jgi:starch synthase
MVASECEPFAKTGGLADVVDALSRELGRQGHEVDVYLPLYRGVEPPPGSRRSELTVRPTLRGDGPTATDNRLASASAGGRPIRVGLVTGQANGYRVRLVDHPPSFDRPGLYGERGADYPDNGRRFTLLARACVAAIDEGSPPADLIHGHDWQSGPALMLARAGRTPTVLTCHNLAYHGWVPPAESAALDLPDPEPGREGVDLLRGAIRAADIVNTVSPTYARETLTAEFGAGVDDLLRGLGDRYLGIINGIDPELWDPATDPVIAAQYSRADSSGKTVCKADLLARHGLDAGTDEWGERGAPLLGIVGRLDPQKGFDLLTGAAPQLVTRGARIVALGTGDHSLIGELQAFANQRPDRVAVLDRFDRDEARRIYAGADVFLMPSRFEPCGQGQMISLRYGTVPLVRRTGGLADTIVDADHDLARGNGFVFDEANSRALLEAAERASHAYRDVSRWHSLIDHGMSEDFSWSRSARRYAEEYVRAVTIHAARTALASSVGSAARRG